LRFGLISGRCDVRYCAGAGGFESRRV
jgi:hypothetical protein